MSPVTEKRLMTAEEFLALPDDGVERWLIRGELQEWPKPMTVRNKEHSRLTARLSQLIGAWLDQQPLPRGEIHDGEAGCRLSRDPDVIMGIDLVYVSAEVEARQSEDATLIDGVPILAVEVLSPFDTHKEVHNKIDAYLDAGVPLVWVVDPRDRTVRVYRPGVEVESFNVTRELSGEPHLPGFRVAVSTIFSR